MGDQKYTVDDLADMMLQYMEVNNNQWARLERMIEKVDRNTVGIATLTARCDMRHSTSWSTWGRAGAVLLGLVALASLILGYLQLK